MRSFRPSIVAILAIALLSTTFSAGRCQDTMFSTVVPLNSKAGEADMGSIDSPLVRPTGLSLKLMLAISATLEPKTYSMEIECPLCEIAALSTDSTILGEKHISSDTWNFKDGPYVKEYILDLKATNIDMTLRIELGSVKFSGISKDGVLANLEVLIYDMSSSTAKTVTQGTTLAQTAEQFIPGFPPESVILGLATGAIVLVVLILILIRIQRQNNLSKKTRAASNITELYPGEQIGRVG